MKCDIQHNGSVVMLSLVMVNVARLNVTYDAIMLSVVMLNVIRLNVVRLYVTNDAFLLSVIMLNR
jgi:hypothetical protein